MDAREHFEKILADWGGTEDGTPAVGANLACSFRVGEQKDLGHLQLLSDSGFVILWATVGFLPPDEFSPLRTIRLLQVQDFEPDLRDFALGAEPGTGRLVAAARRTLDELDELGSLAAWIDALEGVLHTVRTALAEEFPVAWDDFDILDTDLGDEGEDSDEDEKEVWACKD